MQLERFTPPVGLESMTTRSAGQHQTYHISLVISKFFPFQNNAKNLDPSYKMDLDFWDCLGRVKLVITAKLHRTDLVICSHFRVEKNPVL